MDSNIYTDVGYQASSPPQGGACHKDLYSRTARQEAVILFTQYFSPQGTQLEGHLGNPLKRNSRSVRRDNSHGPEATHSPSTHFPQSSEERERLYGNRWSHVAKGALSLLGLGLPVLARDTFAAPESRSPKSPPAGENIPGLDSFPRGAKRQASSWGHSSSRASLALGSVHRAPECAEVTSEAKGWSG